MKIQYKGKMNVKVTMTLAQFQAMKAAVDSVTSIGEHTSGAYKDVFRFEDSMAQAIDSCGYEIKYILWYGNVDGTKK